MCDYSLEHYRTRPARAGERYKTHRFPSRTIGFVSPGDCETAVCMQADTNLQLTGIPAEVQQEHGLASSEQAVFTRLENGPYLHRDAIQFRNGATVTLQELGDGITAHVVAAVGIAPLKKSDVKVPAVSV